MRTRDAFLELISPALTRANRDRRVLVQAHDVRRPIPPAPLPGTGADRRIR